MSYWVECKSLGFLFSPIRNETARVFAQNRKRAIRIVSMLQDHLSQTTVRMKLKPTRCSLPNHEELPFMRSLEIALVESVCVDPDYADHVYLSLRIVVRSGSRLWKESSAHLLRTQFSFTPAPPMQRSIEQSEFDPKIQEYFPSIFPHQLDIARQCVTREKLGLCTKEDQKRHMITSKYFNPILLGMTCDAENTNEYEDEDKFDRIRPSQYRGSLSVIEASTGSGKTLCALSVVKFNGPRETRSESPVYPKIDLGKNWLFDPFNNFNHATFAKAQFMLPRGGTLIICPVNLINHWAHELHKWCPEFSVSIFHGPKRHQKPFDELTASDIVLSSTSICFKANQSIQNMHYATPLLYHFHRLPTPSDDAFEQDWFYSLDHIQDMYRVVQAKLVPEQCTPVMTEYLHSSTAQRTCTLWFPIHAAAPIIWDNYVYIPRQDLGQNCHAFRLKISDQSMCTTVGQPWIPPLSPKGISTQTLVFKVQSIASCTSTPMSSSRPPPLHLRDTSSNTDSVCGNAALLRIHWSRLILDEIHLNQSPLGSLPTFLNMVQRDSTIALTASTGPTMLRSISKTLRTPLCDLKHSITRSMNTPTSSVVNTPMETIEYPVVHDLAEQTNQALNNIYFNQLGMQRRGMILMKSIQFARTGLRTGRFEPESISRAIEANGDAPSIENVSVDRVIGDLACCICFASSSDNVQWTCLLPCHHALCSECWEVLQRRSSTRRIPCPLCRTLVRDWKHVDLHVTETTETDHEENSRPQPSQEESPCPPHFDAFCSIVQSVLEKEERMIVFVEMKCKATRNDLQARFPSVEISCVTGDMTLQQKTRALESSCQILVIPYRIGNVGLNLVAFNHVILYHLPGRYDMVQQAIGRVRRVGQDKSVYLHVPFVQNSIDARLWNGWKSDQSLTPKDVVLTL